MNAFQEETIRLSLKEMFKSSHFSICTIRDCIKISGIQVPEDELDCWEALHCVHYNTMDVNFQKQLFESVINRFAQVPIFDFEKMDKVLLGSTGQWNQGQLELK